VIATVPFLYAHINIEEENMAKEKREKSKKPTEAGQCVDGLFELHRLQGALLGRLKKSVKLKNRRSGFPLSRE